VLVEIVNLFFGTTEVFLHERCLGNMYCKKNEILSFKVFAKIDLFDRIVASDKGVNRQIAMTE